MTPRVRFAPSPTGYLHIGGARTALFNWLWARQEGGQFILRIEDTDRERSTKESIDAILESMRWLGLDWDEGPETGGPHAPYFQTQRLGLYREYAEKLIANGHAYRCYCTKEDLAEARAALEKSGTKQKFRYPGTCRARTDSPDRPYVVRFKAPTDGVTGWTDIVRGPIEYPNAEQQDFVLMRSDGVPLYNFGALVDDLSMNITLISRGDDHLINTPPQILLYRALGKEPPAFAHLPMILAPNGEKLSKRHAAVSVLEYRDAGYLPDAVINYLARLGWSHGDQEIFTRQELIKAFSWEHVGKTAGKYDAKKFLYVQAEHLRMGSEATFAERVVPWLVKRGLNVAATDPKLARATPHVRPRASTLVEAAEALDYFFREPPTMDEKAAAKFLTPADAPILRELATLARGVEPFEPTALDAAVRTWLETQQLAMKVVAQPARVALTGRAQSAGLFEVMHVLGREASLLRLEAGAQRAERAATAP